MKFVRKDGGEEAPLTIEKVHAFYMVQKLEKKNQAEIQKYEQGKVVLVLIV